MDKNSHQSTQASALRLSGSGAAWLNAGAIAIAMFFGIIALFGAIALFTNGNWIFDMPGLAQFFVESHGASALMTTAMIALFASIIGLISLRKITDINAMKKSWLVVTRIFIVLAAFYALEMITIAIYGLMGINAKGKVDHGYLWLSGLLPATIKCITAVVIALIAKMISDGKTEVLRIMSFVAIGVAAVALIVAFIATLVNFYAVKDAATEITYTLRGGFLDF